MTDSEVRELKSKMEEKVLNDREELIVSMGEETDFDEKLLVKLLEDVRKGKVITFKIDTRKTRFDVENVDNIEKTLDIYITRQLTDKELANEVHNKVEIIVAEIDRLRSINSIILDKYIRPDSSSEFYYHNVLGENTKLIEKIKKELTIYVK